MEENITIGNRSTREGRWSLEDLFFLGFDKCFPETEANRKLHYFAIKKVSYNLPRHCFGFFDWFCNDFSLANKARKLCGNIHTLVRADKGKHFDPRDYYISFKNCCPCVGGLYDCVRIFPFDDDKISFIFSFVNGIVEFDYIDGDLTEYPTHTFSSFREAVKWFVNDFELPVKKSESPIA